MNVRKFLNQKIVYWAPTGVDGDGNITYADPVQYPARVVVKSQTRSTPVSDISLPQMTVLVVNDLYATGQIALTTLTALLSDDSPGNNGGKEIISVLPFVDRRGTTLAYEVITDAPFTLSMPGGR